MESPAVEPKTPGKISKSNSAGMCTSRFLVQWLLVDISTWPDNVKDVAVKIVSQVEKEGKENGKWPEAVRRIYQAFGSAPVANLCVSSLKRQFNTRGIYYGTCYLV